MASTENGLLLSYEKDGRICDPGEGFCGSGQEKKRGFLCLHPKQYGDLFFALIPNAVPEAQLNHPILPSLRMRVEALRRK